MSTLKIPTPPDGVFSYIYRINLDGDFYRFQWRWNLRDLSWYLDVGDERGNATVRNLRLVIGDDLFEPHKGLGAGQCPQGSLRVVDTSGTYVEADRDELGTRVLIFYDEPEAAA
jgi:hypothetical protein